MSQEVSPPQRNRDSIFRESRAQPFRKLLSEQVKYFLAFLCVFNLLSASHQRPRGCTRIEHECQLLLVLDIAPGHKRGGFMLATFSFQDQCAIHRSSYANRAGDLIQYIIPAQLTQMLNRQDGDAEQQMYRGGSGSCMVYFSDEKKENQSNYNYK